MAKATASSIAGFRRLTTTRVVVALETGGTVRRADASQ